MNERKYPVIVSDFDGTLLRSDHTIAPETVESIRRFVEKGGVFVISTGRALQSILPIAQELGLKGLIAAFSGAVIADIESEKLLFKKAFSVQDGAEICKYMEEQGLNVQIYEIDKYYSSERTPYLDRYEFWRNAGLPEDVMAELNAIAGDEEELKGFFSYINYMNNFDANQSMEYQTKYSGLYVENDFIFEETNDKKVCYLTFDDGPDRNNTARVLDVLKEYDVKATFFVVYKDYKEERALYKRIVEEGHTIGVHTASHNYNKIYSSVDAYLDDFSRCAEQIESVTGVKPEVFRFPGGSVNGYNSQIYREIIAEMTRRGYTYYDWNVSCGDAAAVYVSASKIVNNVLSSSNGIKRKIILMHDGTGHSTTADALPRVIEGLRKQG